MRHRGVQVRAKRLSPPLWSDAPLAAPPRRCWRWEQWLARWTSASARQRAWRCASCWAGVNSGVFSGETPLTALAPQVFRLDFASPKRDLALAGGAVATTERFHRLAWSPSGVETGELPVRAHGASSRHARSRADAARLLARACDRSARLDRGRPGGRHCEPVEPFKNRGRGRR